MERRAHADRCQTLPPDVPDDMDLMIEVCYDRTRAPGVMDGLNLFQLSPTYVWPLGER